MSSEMIPFNEALNDYLEAEERMMVRLDEANGRLRNIITISEQILTGTDISEGRLIFFLNLCSDA